MLEVDAEAAEVLHVGDGRDLDVAPRDGLADHEVREGAPPPVCREEEEEAAEAVDELPRPAAVPRGEEVQGEVARVDGRRRGGDEDCWLVGGFTVGGSAGEYDGSVTW